MDIINLPMRVRGIDFTKKWTDFRVFAIRRHKGQLYDDLPYDYHLASVESYLDEHGYDTWEYRAAAWLHDSVEDTGTKIEDIESLYGASVAAMVWACTGVGVNRKEKNKEIARRLAAYPKAAPVKVADRMANVLHGCATGNYRKLDMYLKEWEEFRKAVEPLMVSAKDSRFFQVLVDLMGRIQADVEIMKTVKEAIGGAGTEPEQKAA